MAWTKRELIEEAFGELAIAGYVFDLTPDEMQAALRRLDTMFATWVGQGVNIGQVVGITPADSDLDDDSGIPLIAAEAAYMNLAVRIAASKGKALNNSTVRIANEAYQSLIRTVAVSAVREQQLRGGTPLGAGAKAVGGVRRPFTPEPVTTDLSNADNGDIVFNGA